jgi:hypothetical protein
MVRNANVWSRFGLVFALLGSAISLSVPAAADDPKVTCPSAACKCKDVKVHACDAKSDGTLYNCRDVSETQCTIVSGPGSGKDISIHR